MTIGQKLSPILVEIEQTIWEHELHSNSNSKPEYPQEALRAAVKIFASVLMDKIYDLQNKEDIELTDRMEMAKKAGEEIRRIVKVYADIDTMELYK